MSIPIIDDSSRNIGASSEITYSQLSGYSQSEINSLLDYYYSLPFPEEVFKASKEMGILPPSHLLLTLGSKKAVGNFDKFIGDTISGGNNFTSFKDFETAFYNSPYSEGVPRDALYKGLVQDYAAFSGLELDSSLHVIGGDWGIIDPVPNFSDPNSPTNSFTGFFKEFTKDYSNRNGELPIGFGLIDRIQRQVQSLPGGVTIQKNHTYTNSPNANAFDGGISFEELYNTFITNGTEEDFQTKINEFYASQITQKGYFNPNTAMGDWINALKAAPANEVAPIENRPHYEISVLNSLMELIIKMISTLQNTAMLQGDRVRFKTQMVNAYSQLKTQIPVFMKGDAGWWGGGGNSKTTDQAQKRDSYNANLAGGWMEKVRALSGVEEDELKTLQGNLSTTSNNVNQQIDLVTSLIQMLKDLSSAIIKK